MPLERGRDRPVARNTAESDDDYAPLHDWLTKTRKDLHATDRFSDHEEVASARWTTPFLEIPDS